MSISNILSVSINTFSGFGSPFTLDWIGNIIKWIIEGTNSIGLGIILFTLILKFITLPLDIISRTSMKKNNLKMKKMRPQLEKFQRQYANNKALYNKKIQALYKKEGYSMFSTCLPTIVTLIIFIVVINQFTAYSNYTNVEMFNAMSKSYTQAIEEYDDSIVYKEKIVVSDSDANKANIKYDEESGVYYTLNCYLNEKNAFNDEYFNSYRLYLKMVDNAENNEYEATFEITDLKAFSEVVLELNKYGYADITVGDNTNSSYILKDGDNYSINPAMFDNLTETEMNQRLANKFMKLAFEDYAEKTVKNQARLASKKAYEENSPHFLWIKNLWTPDLPYKHPVNEAVTDYDFYAKVKENVPDAELQFNEITYLLSEQKDQPNGFFILVVLSIGTMFLSQLIATKSQKDSLDLQSVDGQGATQSKMMMWMMPIIFGVFSFMYSASFSLYMTISTVFSVLSTVIINFFVEKAFNKKYGIE